MNFLMGTGFSFCFAQLLAIVVPSAAYFQTTTGGGYTFSIPTFNSAEMCNQAAAQAWCNGNKSQLLEIRNNDIQFWTKSFIGSAIGQNHMTGNTIITNGKRSNSGLIWVNGISIAADINVKGQEPGHSHSYAYINVTQSGFQIVADTPTVKRGYICEGASFCSNGFRASDRCYSRNSDQSSSWFDARNRCTEGRGDLASFDFIADGKGFNVLNGSGLNPSSTYWIGLRRQNWTWQDSKSDVVYSQWSNAHPDYAINMYKECLCLEPNNPTLDWKWSECDCNQPYQFVCMTGTSLTSSAAPVTSANPLTPSTTIAGDTRTHSLNTSSSVSNSGSISTAALENSKPADNSLAIGLGVGIGGGVLLIAVILVIVFVMMKRKGCPRKLGLQKSPPDVTPESYYATVVKNTEYDETTQDGYSNQVPPPTEYADLNIVTVSRSTDDRHERGRSLV